MKKFVVCVCDERYSKNKKYIIGVEMKKIVIYARYSSDRQTEQSIEGQLRVCHEYAERNDYVVVHEYIDRALSGTTNRRPAFLQMIEDSKKKEFEYVLVYQLDRFARNRYDSANYKMKLKKNGVRVLSARENISDDASGILMESVIAEAGSSHMGTRYKYYKCHTKKVKGKACLLRNYRKHELEQLIIDKTKKYILTPSKIEEIAHMVVNRYNSEISNNVVLKCLEKELRQINNKINSLVKNMEQGIVSLIIRETLYKLENDRADIQLKIAEEKSKFDKPLNFEDVKNFISLFACKDYDDVFERNEFFNRFIKKVLLFNDKIIVIMRGSKGAENELAINNDELYAKRILEKFEKKEISENDFENKNGSLDNMGSHFCENDKILKEKEAELDFFVHQPPRGGKRGI